jgi:hypothetical protein
MVDREKTADVKLLPQISRGGQFSQTNPPFQEVGITPGMVRGEDDSAKAQSTGSSIPWCSEICP